jgi:hypothetical protein
MALSKKEYSEMMKYLTRPATSSAQLGARAGTRAGFKEGTEFKEETKLSDYIKPNVYANTGSSDRGGVKVDNKTISAVINLNIPLTKKLKIISDINAGASKTKVDLSELGKKYGVDLGTETYRDKNLNIGVGGEYTFDSGAKLRAMIDPENKSGQVSIGMPFQKGGRAGFKEGTNPQKTKMILDMLRRGADVDTISTITGATVEEINKIAMTAKPISTEKPVNPEEGLSKNKTYSEIDILSNIEAKFPGGNTRDDIIYNPMPNPVPRMDNYMPEIYGMDNPKDVARYRQVPLKKGGRPIDTPADVAVENSLFNPKTYGKYAKKIATTPLARSAAKLTGAELALAVPLSIFDYEAGYTPKEILLNIGTLGFGTSIADDLKMIKALGPKKLKLLQQYAAQGTKRRLDRRKGIESIMDKEMQEALNARDEFFQKLEEKRAKLGEERLLKGELESERIGMMGEAEGD